MKILIIIAILIQSIAYATGPKTDAIQAAVNYVFDQEDNAEKAQEIFLQLLLSSKSSVDFSNSINAVNQYIQKRDPSQKNEFNYLQLNASLQTFCLNIKSTKMFTNEKVPSTLLSVISAIISLMFTVEAFDDALPISKRKKAGKFAAAWILPLAYGTAHYWIIDYINYPSNMDHNLPAVCN